MSHAKAVAGTGALLACAFASAAHAAPDEIVVYTDDFEKKGEVGFELHLNYAARARKTQDYPGEQPPHHIVRVMPEVVWGIADKWNFGVHVPFSYNPHTGTTTLDGAKPRLHYLNVIEHGDDRAFYYGVNFEVAWYTKRITETRYTGEIRTIFGMRQGAWKVTLNPIIHQPLSKSTRGRASEFELYGQVMRALGQGFAVGVEHYASTGELSKPTWDSRSGQISYIVVDFETKKHLNLHVGVGRGWNGATDKLVYKAMLNLPF